MSTKKIADKKPKNKIKLSVILTCYNDADTIATQLEALANQQWHEPWEVIVSDNGSTDDSLGVIEQYKHRLPNLQIIDASYRRGQAYALNKGAEASVGESLVFCDADDMVGENWLAAIAEALSRNDFVASRFETRKLNSSRFYMKLQQEDGLLIFHPDFLPYSGGCGLGVKRSLFEASEGFDEEMLLIHDVDFCFQIQLAGTTLCFVPEAVMHIRHRNTLRGMFRQRMGWGEYSVFLYKKYLPLGMPKITWKSSLISLSYLFYRIIKIRNREDFCIWVCTLGAAAGRMKGCVKYRIFAF